MQCIVGVEDALRLGIKQGAHNVLLSEVIDLSGKSSTETWEVDGKKILVAGLYLKDGLHSVKNAKKKYNIKLEDSRVENDNLFSSPAPSNQSNKNAIPGGSRFFNSKIISKPAVVPIIKTDMENIALRAF